MFLPSSSLKLPYFISNDERKEVSLLVTVVVLLKTILFRALLQLPVNLASCHANVFGRKICTSVTLTQSGVRKF